MQGGVRKRGTTWSYYFDLGKIDGKRKKKEKGGFKTKKEAVKSKFVCKFIFQLCGFIYATFIFKRFD